MRILIIGGGFSGTVTAAHLLRRAGNQALNLTIVNREAPLGRGLAYGTTTPIHVLNVPAGRMSAFVDDEDNFVRFAQTRDPSITGAAFVPRSLYGDYLEHVLTQSENQASKDVRLQRLVGDVIDLVVHSERSFVEAVLADGSRHCFDRVVLAFGNHPPAALQIHSADALHSARYIHNPWAPSAMAKVDVKLPVLLIGTGLTALDVALDLHERGLHAPIIALSRHGLLPIAHRLVTAPPTFEHCPPDIETIPPTALGYLRSVRNHIRQLAKRGVDWREVMSSLRPITPQLWTRLPSIERAIFLRHLRVFWDVHRHRAAPVPHAMFQRLISDGQLRVIAARLRDLKLSKNAFHAHIVERHSGQAVELLVGTVINCTGPQTNVWYIEDRLVSSLLQRGYIRADTLQQGLDVTQDLTVVDKYGVASKVMYYVGPLLRARYWEATAVPELRVHAERLAQILSRAKKD